MNVSNPKWPKVPLSQVAVIQTGLAKGKSGFKEFVELPYLRVANVQDGYLDLALLKLIRIEKRMVERYLLKKGDVLLTEGGDFDKLGRGAIWNDEVSPCIHQNHIFVVRPIKDVLTPEYLSLLTGSDYGKKYFQSCSKQSTNLASINSTQLKAFPVLLLPINEQKEITNCLSHWDSAVEKTERLIAAKENRLQWLRQQITTGKTKLSDSAGKWKKVRLNEVLMEHEELSTGKEEVCSVSVHKGVINQVEHLGRVFSAKDTSNYNLVKPGDIIYTKSPTGNFPLGIIKQSKLDRKVIVSPLYGVFTPITADLGTILDCYFDSEVNTKNYLSPIVQKGAKNTINITNTTFLSNSLFLPMDPGEQRRIALLLSIAKQEISLLKERVDAYRKQKRGLMQKLLTGQWRVKAD